MWTVRIISSAQRRLRRYRSEGESEIVEPSIQVVDSPSRPTQRRATDPEQHRSLPLLFNLCRRWAWPAVQFRCGTHPHEVDVIFKDQNGDTALHWAVFGNPPEEAIVALLTACPELASVANNEGLIPLHGKITMQVHGVTM